MRKSILLCAKCFILVVLVFGNNDRGKEKVKRLLQNSYRISEINVIIPDTVCVNQPVEIINNSLDVNSSLWTICKGDQSLLPIGTLISNPSNTLERPNYIHIEKEGSNYIGLVTNDKEVSLGYITRLNFGNSLTNTPVATNLGNFGQLLNHPAGLTIIKDGNNYHAFLLNSGQSPIQYRIVRLDFGNSLLNTPTAVNLGNPIGFNYPFEISIHLYNGEYIGFFEDLSDNLFRIEFGTNIKNVNPVITNLGNVGSFSRSFKHTILFENGNWYMFLVNDNASGGGSISRLNFGNSLKNTPTGSNLGSFGGLLERPGSVVGIKDCDHWKLYVTSLTKPNMIELDFSAGLGNNPSAKNLGNVNGGSVSGGNSNFIFYNGEKYVFYVNTISNNLSRTVFPKCSDIGIGPFIQFTPPTFSFPQSGVYQISYTANEGTPTEQNYCKSIVVLDGTNINLGNDTSYCGNFSRVLTTGIPSTLWSTGQTGSSITVSQPGTYWAEINQPCGKVRDSIVIGLNQNIQINIGNDTTYCGNFSRVLTTGIPSTLWSTGQTGSSITVSQPGTYWAEVNQPCGKVRDSIVIGLNQNIQINIGNDTTYCGNFSRVLTTGIPNTLWSTGQTGSSITVSQPGTYWAEVNQPCGKVRDSIVIGLNQNIQINIGNDTTYCGNFSRVLTTGIPSTLWSTGQTGSSITVSQPGTYWAEVTQPCGKIRDSIVIGLNQSIQINIGNDTTYCGNFSRVLTTGIPSTLWSTGQTGSSITVSQPGTYWAEIIQPCGKVRDSIVIGLNQSIQINIGNDTAYCGNFSRVLTTGIPSTLWSTGQTGSSITVSQPGTYWAEVTNSCGAFRDSIIINLDESVSFYLGNDTVICGNFSKTLITGLSNTIWSTGESGSQIIVGQLGTYWAEVTGDCGVYRDTIVISDKNCGCGTIEFPNAFSPNVDQVNDIFKPLYACKITYFRFMVFNRWGEKVFETNNPKEGWDGKYQGEMAPLDSYAWYCEYTYESEDKVNKAKGMVTIIR